MPDAAEAEVFVASVDALLQRGQPGVSTLEAGVLAAAHFGLAGDSRSFARVFGLAHALTLRAMAEAEALGLLAVVKRDPRTQRSFWRLTAAGHELVRQACGAASQPNAADDRRDAPISAV